MPALSKTYTAKKLPNNPYFAAETNDNDGIGDFNLFNRNSTNNIDDGPTYQLPPNETEEEAKAPQNQPHRTREKRKRSRYYETQDLVDSVEHIMTIGSHNRHKQWRQAMWKKQEEEERQQESSDGQNHSAKPPAPERDSDSDSSSVTNKKSDLQKAHFLHAEDVRIYGLAEGFPADPWPKDFRGTSKRFKVPNDKDAPWDQEHGDKINRLDFTRDVLSNVIPHSNNNNEEEEEDDSVFAHSMELQQLLDPTRMDQLDPDRLKCTTDAKDVPRALLLRCWQRAMDAASFSTLQQPQKPTQFVHDLKNITRLQQLQKPASQRCVDLTVDMFPWGRPSKPPFGCRLCGNDFETRQQLQHHFHGTEHVRGCAWSEIHSKQRELIATALEKEVVSQADTLVQFIVTSARDRLNTLTLDKTKATATTVTTTTTNQPEIPELFSWKDALDIMKEALLSSEEFEDVESDADGEMPPLQVGGNTTPVREVTKTLQVRDDLPPLVFNHQVLEAVSSRLTDRYAPFPL